MSLTNSDGVPLYLKSLKEQLRYIVIALIVILGIVAWLLLWPAKQALGESKQKYELLALQLANTNKKERDEQQQSLSEILHEKNRMEDQWQEWQPYEDVTLSQADVLTTLRVLAAKSGLQLKQAIWHPHNGLPQAKKLTIELHGDFDQVINFTSATLALEYLFVPLSMHLSSAERQPKYFKLTTTLHIMFNEQSGYLFKVGNAAKNKRQYWLTRLPKVIYTSSANTAIDEGNLLPIIDCLDSEDLALTTLLGSFRDDQTSWVVLHTPVKGLRFVEVGAWVQQWRVSRISTKFILLEKADKTRCRISMQGGKL